MKHAPFLTLIGIGDDGVAGLTARARDALESARLVVGGQRHLAMIDRPQRGLSWRTPIADSLAEIEAARPGPVAVLASGDPSWFGVAKLFEALLRSGEAEVMPALSSLSLAAARLCWPLEETRCLSACGRPLEGIWPHLAPGARLMVLSAGAQTPGELAAGLCARGFAPSRMSVMEHLGGAAERIRETRADGFDLADMAALNLVAIECEAASGAPVYSRVPGLPDEAFATDGTMTKRVLRASALSALAPRPGELLWDVGSGSGSIAVEWLRTDASLRAIAIEPRAERRAFIEANAMRLCVAGLSVVEGHAPKALAGLEPPDAVFFGGGLSMQAADIAMAALKSGGRLVAHGVTVETQALIADLHAAHGGEMLRIGVEAAEPLGRYRGWRPAMPVVHWHWTKP